MILNGYRRTNKARQKLKVAEIRTPVALKKIRWDVAFFCNH